MLFNLAYAPVLEEVGRKSFEAGFPCNHVRTGALGQGDGVQAGDTTGSIGYLDDGLFPVGITNNNLAVQQAERHFGHILYAVCSRGWELSLEKDKTAVMFLLRGSNCRAIRRHITDTCNNMIGCTFYGQRYAAHVVRDYLYLGTYLGDAGKFNREPLIESMSRRCPSLC